MSKLIVVQGQGEWEALYQDGKLIHQGHNVTEQAYVAAGIEMRYDELNVLTDGKQGRATSEGCAPTIAEFEAREETRRGQARAALDMRREAQQLLDQAGALDGRPLVVAHKDELVKGTRPEKWVKP